MGQKVSVDSATLMNKALEMIEAYWLFGLPFDAIHAVVHPQSIVHAMVGYVDGSTLAQCGYPDMRVPIAYGLSYPDRIETGVASLDYFKLGSLVFEEPDHACFPALKMVAEVVKSGASAPIIFNAANEIAVAEFLKGRLPFLGIYDLVSAALDVCEQHDILTIDDALDVDVHARAFASEWCQRNAYADASVLI
jgi:1-deoxy-D-xylulose-5-phosphate reductoisomerase